MKNAPNTHQTPTVQLWNYAHQRPGLSFADYGDATIYRRELREIISDLHDFRQLFALASKMYGIDLDQAIADRLTNTGDRLAIENGKLRYHVGQYWPTEYRPACNRVLRDLIWNKLRNDYETGDQIRKAARRMLSRRVCRYYFN